MTWLTALGGFCIGVYVGVVIAGQAVMKEWQRHEAAHGRGWPPIPRPFPPPPAPPPRP